MSKHDLDTTSDDSDEFCGYCSGSGEGMHDGSRCWACGGTGIPKNYDLEAERRAEAADHYNDMKREEGWE